VQLSASQDSQVAADTSKLSGGVPTGAATFCFIKACEDRAPGSVTYGDLLLAMWGTLQRAGLGEGGFHGEAVGAGVDDLLAAAAAEAGGEHDAAAPASPAARASPAVLSPLPAALIPGAEAAAEVAAVEEEEAAKAAAVEEELPSVGGGEEQRLELAPATAPIDELEGEALLEGAADEAGEAEGAGAGGEQPAAAMAGGGKRSRRSKRGKRKKAVAW
jgi:hypothetical protein